MRKHGLASHQAGSEDEFSATGRLVLRVTQGQGKGLFPYPENQAKQFQLKPADLESFQAKRKAQRLTDPTIDQDVKAAQAMISKVFDNDKVNLKSRTMQLEARDTKDNEPRTIRESRGRQPDSGHPTVFLSRP